MLELTDEGFESYKQFLINTYPRIASKEFKASWEEVEFCSGKVEDFGAMTLIRFLEGKGLKDKIPQPLIDSDLAWKEECKKYDATTEEGAKCLAEAFDKLLKTDTLDVSNFHYDYTIDENFKIEDIMTREMATKFLEHYNLDLEYYCK